MRMPTNEEIAALSETIVRALEKAEACEHARPSRQMTPCATCQAGLVSELILGALYEREGARP